MNKSESIKEIASALLMFQTTVGKITKNCENPYFHSKYADLSTILETIREPLANAGLSFVQFPKGNYEMETMIMHTSGEWMSETYQMRPAKDDPQGAGSVITYQRRYALGSILGLDIDDDDDGNGASKQQVERKPKNQSNESKATDEQIGQITDLMLDYSEDRIKKVLDYAKIKNLNDLTEPQAAALIVTLKKANNAKK